MKKFYVLLFALLIVSGARAQSCLPEGIEFSTQAQIDNFQTNYPNCTHIEGSVIISGSDITNLDGLSVVTSIGDGLCIGKRHISGNPALTSLTGLENITYIGGSFEIYYNHILTSLTGLEGITSIGDDLYIEHNDALTSLTGLDNLTFIGGALSIDHNDSLNNLTGLEGLPSIWGYLSIDGNAALTSLTGLEGLQYIGGGLCIGCYNGWGFKYGNPLLSNLTGLNNVITIGGDLFISYNESLTSLSGLEGLTSIGGGLTIAEDISLPNLSGLDNLTSIGGGLWIEGGDNGNPALTSLSGLDNIAEGSINDLIIIGNYSLSTCDVQSICDYLANPNGTVEIYDNATGCNSPEEVDSACVYLSNGEVNLPPAFYIYPNPASTTITISTPTTPNKNTSLTICNISGQQLISRQITEQQTIVDVSWLPQGVYIVKVTDESEVQVGKIIRQ
jgi:hypothetical protein